eukprot:GFYU01002332.1.p1 GENE.GFYU01002332.1~~GFYU01002332.1.p1  ORF type:complete len:590 (+),score=125.70 GFYU01002332.1:171-1940(+)
MAAHAPNHGATHTFRFQPGPSSHSFTRHFEFNMDDTANLAEILTRLYGSVFEYMPDDSQEFGPPPTSRSVLSQIPEIKVEQVHADSDLTRSCSVCFEDHQVGEKAMKLPCNHMFHSDCIKPWLEQHCTCPVCRYELQTDDPSFESGRRERMHGRGAGAGGQSAFQSQPNRRSSRPSASGTSSRSNHSFQNFNLRSRITNWWRSLRNSMRPRSRSSSRQQRQQRPTPYSVGTDAGPSAGADNHSHSHSHTHTTHTRRTRDRMTTLKTQARKTAEVLEKENNALERKLSALKDQMAAEKERRTTIRKKKGSLWGSATTDVPIRGHADQILSTGKTTQKLRRINSRGSMSSAGGGGGGGTVGVPKEVKQPMPPSDQSSSRQQESRGSSRGAPRRLISPKAGGLATTVKAKASPRTITVKHDVQPPPGQSMFFWNPDASLADTYGESDLAKPPATSLLDGEFDEEAERLAFQKAVAEWRTPGAAATVTGSASGRPESAQKRAVATFSAGTGTEPLPSAAQQVAAPRRRTLFDKLQDQKKDELTQLKETIAEKKRVSEERRRQIADIEEELERQRLEDEEFENRQFSDEEPEKE